VSLGPAEILVILVIALLVFGPTRLPEVGRQVGRTMREFRKFQAVMKRDLDEVFRDDEPADGRHGAEPAPSLPPKALSAGSDAVAPDDAASTVVDEPGEPGELGEPVEGSPPTSADDGPKDPPEVPGPAR
jgi:TatA/E family protein of Tat protein translocase